MEQTPKQKPTLQTVDRALDLIDIMARSSEKLGVMEISRMLGITRAGTYTLLNTLMAKHFVERDPATNKYHIGYKFLELGASYRYQYPFVVAAERGIYSLSRRWKHQINLTVLKPPCLSIFLLTKAPEETHKAVQRVALPAYATAGGKYLLSCLDDERLLETLEQVELRRFARQTIVDRDKLLQGIAEIRKNGYAVEREESNNQKGCIAAPIRDISGEAIATISMVMRLEDMDAKFDQYLEDILDTCDEVSMELGYNPYAQS